MLVRAKKKAPRHKMAGGQPPQPVPATPYPLPAPINGWVLSENLATPMPASAKVLDNYTPTTSGIDVRGGHALHATLDAAVTAFMTYTGTAEKLFAATATRIYDVTTPAATDTEPTAYHSGFTSGDWSSAMMNVAGNDWLVMVNGTDTGQIYNTTTGFHPWTDEGINTLSYDALSAAFSIGETVTGGTSGASAEILGIEITGAATGVLKLGAVTSGPFQDNEALTSAAGAATAASANASATSFALAAVTSEALSHVAVYAERLWFVEGGTLKAWYLPVTALSGTATSFSLGGVFRKGGSLLFIASHSGDSGEGMDDRIVFVSTEGEAAIYAGTDPTSDFTLMGVYDIPRPLGKDSHIRAGGDLLIGTEAGIIPLSSAIQQDIAAVAGAAVSKNIASYWQEKAARITGNWQMVKVLDDNLLIVSQPGDSDNGTLCVNLQTGAWARWTGVRTQCLGLYDDDAYCGDNGGLVYQMNGSGADNGALYTARYLGNFETLGMPGATKTILQARPLFETASEFNAQLMFKADFNTAESPPPSAPVAEVSDGWDAGLWDSALWDGGAVTKFAVSDWQPQGATGVYLAPELQMSFNQSNRPVVSLVSIDVMMNVGEMVT
jgi:hypothetical protein